MFREHKEFIKVIKDLLIDTKPYLLEPNLCNPNNIILLT